MAHPNTRSYSWAAWSQLLLRCMPLARSCWNASGYFLRHVYHTTIRNNHRNRCKNQVGNCQSTFTIAMSRVDAEI